MKTNTMIKSPLVAIASGGIAFATVHALDAKGNHAASAPNITLDSKPIDRVQVGNIVLAVGNPFGIGESATMGMVSAIGRATMGLGATLANQPDDEKPPTALQSGKRPTEQQNLFETFESRPP